MRNPFVKWAILVLASNTVISLLNIRSIKENASWVVHTHEVAQLIEETLGDARDAETGCRGYMVTGDKKFLEPYYKGIENSQNHIEKLSYLTQDNPVQVGSIPVLNQKMDERLKIIQETIEVKEANQDIKSFTYRGKACMDDLRTVVAKMKAEEERLLRTRVSRLDRAYVWMLGTTIVFNLVALAIFFAVHKHCERQVSFWESRAAL